MDMDMVVGVIAAIAIIGIVMGTVSGIAKRSIQLKEKRLELEARGRGTDTGPLLEKISLMEDRIRNLERIATDDRPSLSAQIEALRIESDEVKIETEATR